MSLFETLSNIWTNVKPILPSIAEGIGTYAGYMEQSDDVSDAAGQYAADQQRAANILKAGYDQQLSEYESGLGGMEDLYRQSYADTSKILGGGADTYTGDLRRATSTYSDMIYPEYDVYGDTMYGVEDETGQLIDETGQQFEDTYRPYTEAGNEALYQMKGIAAADPTKMTAEQEIALKDYDKNAAAALASSGLRGAGKAGVAAILDGRQRLMANFISQNQGRGDTARSTIAQQGYGATGQVAGNQARLGLQKAANKLQTGTDVAKTGFETSRDVANKYLTSENALASNKMNTSKDLTNLTGKLYGGLTDVAQTRTQARGDTAINKAMADAAAIQGGSGVNFAANASNAQNKGDTIGKLANAASGVIKSAAEGSPPTGGSSTTPWRYTPPTTYTINGAY